MLQVDLSCFGYFFRSVLPLKLTIIIFTFYSSACWTNFMTVISLSPTTTA